MPTTILDNESYPKALQRRYEEEAMIDRKIEIIAMAKSAGFFEFNVEGWVKEFGRFAALVAAHEREACAKVCDKVSTDRVVNASDDYQEGRDMGAIVCAAAIRARDDK